jgi:hypothetical protein
MGLFKNITKALKSAAPVIGGTIGFGLGGPMGAAIGSGIGGLAAGQDVDEALKTAAIGGALGYGARGMGFAPAAQGGFMPRFVGSEAAAGYGLTGAKIPVAGAGDPFAVAGKVGQSTGLEQKGIMSALGDFASENKMLTAGLGLGALGLAMTPEEEAAGERRPFPKGEMFDFTARSRETGDVYQLNDPEDLADYRREISDFNYNRGGSVDTLKNYTDKQLSQMSLNPTSGGQIKGPGTGISDSVMAGIYSADGSYEGPARLSDGEFVITEKAVVGAGGGDRDIGAARMYDMMAELEAQA